MVVNYSPSRDWNPKQKTLRELLGKPESFDSAQALCLELHGMVHFREPGDTSLSLMEAVRDGLTEAAFRHVPPKAMSIAWNLWHITRIEDIVTGNLIARADQVFDDVWLRRLASPIRDTGNALDRPELEKLSGSLNMQALFAYRRAVGYKTREVIKSLSVADLERKPAIADLEKVMGTGSLTAHPDSAWLLDFWGRKTVAGLLLMPITRHQAGHLNDCLKLKKTV